MERLTTPAGVTVSYDKAGSGPSLVLVHGSFSDHHTNWEFVKPVLKQRFTVYAIARRGRGETDTTDGHSLEDEARDVAAVIEAVAEPVFLVGHSYGAQCTLAAALLIPGRIRKLVVYEPPQPSLVTSDALARLEALAADEAWEDFTLMFFRERLSVPEHELDELRATDLWPPTVADAKPSLGDLRAVAAHRFDAERFRHLQIPVLLQVGSESPRHLYVTDALAAVLPNASIEVLPGQAHEGMTTAPDMYVASVTAFLLGDSA